MRNRPAPSGRGRVVDEMFAFGDPPDYSPPPESRLDKRAAREGTTVLDLAYDILLEADGHAMLYYPAANFAYGNLDHTFELMPHRDTVIGLGDGGAHVARTCDSSIPSHVLAYWSRDRTGNRLPLGTAVRLITHDTAQTVGLGDRGVLAPGYDRRRERDRLRSLQMRAPVVQHDLPAGGARLVQQVDGYVATVKSGTPTFRDGTSTGAFPGRLVRGSR